MAAGSVIGAMGGEQSLDRMGGFRKAMPFTFGCFVIGGLALSGVPPFSGFFSKDEILLVRRRRGGWHWVLYVARLHRRAVLTAHLHLPDDLPRVLRRAGARGARADRARPPAPRRAADQPGQRRGRGHRRRLPRARAPHRRARAADEDRDGRCWPSGAIAAGVLQIPRVTNVLEQLPRADVRATRRSDVHATTANLDARPAARRGPRPAGHLDRLPRCGSAARDSAARIQARFPPLHACCPTSGTSTS